MSPASLSITFHLEIFGRHVTLARDAAASETLETVTLKLLRSTGIGDSLEGWEILREEGEPLSFDQKVSELVRDRWSGNISVTLRLTMQLPGRPAATAESKADIGGGPRLPNQRPGAPVTRHQIRLPNVNDVTTAGDDTDLEEGPSSPTPEKKPAEVTNGKAKPATAAKPASKPMMAPPKPAAKPPSKPMMAPPKPGAATSTPAAKPPSKPMMAPPKPAASAPAAKPPSKPMMAPPKPAASAPAAKPPSKPMMAPPKPAAKPPSKPMMAPPAAAAPPPAVTRGAAPDGKKDSTDLLDTDFDIPPMQEPGSNVVAVNQVKEEARARSADRDDTAAEIYLEQSTSQVVDEEVDDEEPAAMAEARASRKKGTAKRTVERRATVRYYNRMNPQRVFPMLVVISKQMIERAAQAQADQKTTGPFTATLDSAIEIEPVLPGCYCYPPKASARLGNDDLTLTFHVVPHVLGEVTGACIHVRQDHYELARLDLDIKVVQRTWVLFTGALAVGLPFLSALARHLHFDVGTQKDAFLLAMDAVVNNVPPLALMGGFAALTLLVFWLTRATRTDEFFDVTPIGPEEKLKQISERMESDPSRAADDLMYLLKSHPDHLPARLACADCYFRLGNHAEALSAYQAVLAKTKTEDRHYLQAARSAARVGDWVAGSKILSAADEALTRERTAHRDFEEVRQELRGAARQTV
jgi:tetratricopeptide (TPR) repeat protein